MISKQLSFITSKLLFKKVSLVSLLPIKRINNQKQPVLYSAFNFNNYNKYLFSSTSSITT